MAEIAFARLDELTGTWEDIQEARDQTFAARDTAVAASVTAVSAKDTAVAAKDTAVTAAGTATTQAGIATTKASEATTARDWAYKWAQENEDVPVNDGVHSGYSAYHWSQKAATFNPSSYVLKAGDTMTGALTLSSGDITISAGGITVSNANGIAFSGRSRFRSNADGTITMLDSTNADFGRLNFGGDTSSYPAIKRSTNTLQARLADDSAYANMLANQFYADGGYSLHPSMAIVFNTRSQITSPADGNFLLRNNAGTDFTQLLFGGTSASFPSLKRVGSDLYARFADDSGDTNFFAAALSSTVGYFNVGSPLGSTGYGLRSNGGTMEAKNSGGSWSAIGVLDLAQTWTAPQTAGAGTLTSGSGANFTTAQLWNATVNGSAFTVTNPTAIRGNTLYVIRVSYTTSHTVNFGTSFKGTIATPTATSGQVDYFWFQSNSGGTVLEYQGASLKAAA